MVVNILERKDIQGANIKGADLIEANLEGANLMRANLEGANLIETDLEGANLKEANLKEANLEEAKLEGAHHLSLNQFSKVKTLHSAKLDKKFLLQLKEKYPTIFEVPYYNE